MSGSNNAGGKGAGLTTAASGMLLPFTGGHKVVSYVVLTALLCGAVILLSKLVKRVAVR